MDLKGRSMVIPLALFMLALVSCAIAFVAGQHRATRSLTYSSPPGQVDRPVIRRNLQQQDGMEKALTGGEAQALAIKLFGRFAPLIQNFEPAGFSDGTGSRFYTSPHASGFPGICSAERLAIEPDEYHSEHLAHRRVFRVVGSLDRNLMFDDGYQQRMAASCASIDPSRAWFTARFQVVHHADPENAGDERSAAWDGARSIDLAITAARAPDQLPFVIDCDKENVGDGCNDPKKLLGSVDPREIAWLWREREIAFPLCRETTVVEMLPQGSSARKYVITTIEEERNCGPEKTLHFAMTRVSISEDNTIIN
jgi:hypothetical protein